MLYKEINMSYLLECHPRVDFQVKVQFLLEDSIFLFFFFLRRHHYRRKHARSNPFINECPPTGFSIQKWRDGKPSDPIDNLDSKPKVRS